MKIPVNSLSFSARLAGALALTLLLAPAASAQKKTLPDHWVTTWATANYQADNQKTNLCATDTTFREILRTSVGGGDLIRVELSNEYGTEPLTIGGVHLALNDNAKGPSSDIQLLSANAMTFNGSPTVVIPPGTIAISDPAALKVPPLTELAVSIFVPAQNLTKLSFHNGAYNTSYLAPGNVIGKSTLSAADLGTKKITSYFFLKAIDIDAPANTGTIVAFGDSITDGAHSSLDGHATWPEYFAARLQANPGTKNLGVANEGIGGNRVLHDGTGPSAQARFDRDVLSVPGARALILLEGINDIGHAFDPRTPNPTDVVSAEDIIAGLSQLAARAHTKGLKVYGATLTPYLGAGYQSPAGEEAWAKVNAWIRTTHDFDGFFDFDKATEDPATPGKFLPADDSGDHLHPKDAGYKAMADAIDLSLFATPTKKR